MNLYLTVIKHL